MIRQVVACLVLGAFASSLAGCADEVEVHYEGTRISTGDAPRPKSTREKDLIDRVKKDEKDHTAWFELGLFYYDGGEWEKAATAYERANALMCPDPDKATLVGGYILLAKTYVHMRPPRYDLAMKNLDMIARLEPKDAKEATRNWVFREAHHIRGAIYYFNRNAKMARQEFARYLDLGGDEGQISDALEDLRNAE